MKATDVLVDEHRVIERALDALEAAAGRLEAGQAVRPEFFLSAVDFIRGYADGCHHQKEEGILFTRMEAQGIPLQGCPLGVMLAEHELARQYTRALQFGAESLQKGNPGGVNQIVHSARSYVGLLRSHINKEDTILFPMAERVIPAMQHEQVWADFEPVVAVEAGDGVHDKYLALAAALERELAQAG